ncbi:cell division protein SepF [Ligilactobacillus salivarius]|uniref:cell division protein SepF n=1 Tax=Ligilactobacillus salivarius TaxID=1624 RepID=UPI00136F877D|nr:cell division protein SepF [Ligilactobacillus salivarius]MYV00747.1 cell division protein SepF [Ligilactobacillus salivarius]
MSLSEKLSNWFNGVPEEEYYEEVTDSKQAVSTNTDVNRASEPEKDNNRQVMSLMSSKNNSTTVQREQKIMVFDPSVFSDVKNIGKMILNGRAVIVNFRKMDENQIHRVIDFLSGLIFAVNGDMQRIGEKMFLCTPKNFKIEGDLSNLTGR